MSSHFRAYGPLFVFFDFQSCSMICIDVHWCSLIIDDVHLGPMIYMDVRWFYMCFLRCVCVWCSFFFKRISLVLLRQFSTNFSNVHWCSLSFDDFNYFLMIFLDVWRISLVFNDFHWLLMIFIDFQWISLIVFGFLMIFIVFIMIFIDF